MEHFRELCRHWICFSRAGRMNPRQLLLTCLVCGVASAGSSCSVPSPDDDGARYLRDAHFRRDQLVTSLVNPENGYSQIRLAHYDTSSADDWSHLPEWNPRVEPVLASEL